MKILLLIASLGLLVGCGAPADDSDSFESDNERQQERLEQHIQEYSNPELEPSLVELPNGRVVACITFGSEFQCDWG